MECDYTTFFHEKTPIRAKPEPEQTTINNIVFETDKQLMKISDRFSGLQKLAKERGIQYCDTVDDAKTSENTGIDNAFHKRKQNLLIRLGERVNRGFKSVCRNKIAKPYQQNSSKNGEKTCGKFKKFHYRSSRSYTISKRQLDCELDFYMAKVGDTIVCDEREMKDVTNISNVSQSDSSLIDMAKIKKLFSGFGGPNWRKKIVINDC